MNLIERYKKPTPSFFRRLSNIGIVIASTGAIILTAPVAFSALIITIAGYLTVAGTVITTISEAVVSDNVKESESNGQ